ncbi:MAG: GGDEF domain-containing protein [Ruminococcus sp.]|nr:GGDEF domain-containing protein [Ruminococcus sp.]
MDGVLCSSNFQEFFSRIVDNADTLSQLISLLGDNFHLISKEISVGRLNFEVDEHFSLEEIGTSRRRYTLFTEDYYNSASVMQRHFKAIDNGSVLIEMYPTSGHIWNEAEEKAINFLLETLYTLCAKTRSYTRLKELAITDQLTEVLNNEGLTQLCEKMLINGTIGQYSAVLVNIRNFKFINQNIGTKSGDKVLRAYAQKLVGFAGGGCVARIGGDSFLVLVRNKLVDDFIAFTEIITINISEYVKFDLTAKLGIYKIGPIDTINDIINCASIAYGAAKQSPNDRYVYFNSEIYRRSTTENEISAIFRQALKNNEFQVFFQPKVRMDTGRLCGCEALVRWHKNGCVVSPNDFISVLERDGTICDLDFYMLDETCRCIRYWLDNSICPVRVSVNFSKIHLHNLRIADEIHDVLKTYNVPTKYIEIELTETSCHEDYNAMLAFIKEMRSRGFGISIDDFGTGYSSLNMLKDIHVDVIKLDKSFVDSIEECGEQGKIVVRNIVNTIIELGMEVIAEGVEKLSQVNFLEGIGCEMAQGYRFGKPMEIGKFTNELISNMG